MASDLQTLADRAAEYLRLFPGRENAVTKADLADDLGLAGPRALRELHDAIADLVITHHLPVCGGTNGYYLATDAADRRATVHSLRRRAIRILRRAKHLKLSPLWPRHPLRQRKLFEPPRPEEARAHIEIGVA